MSDYAQGQRVRFTADNLGCLEEPGVGRFLDHHVMADDEGVYQEPHPSPLLGDWHHCTVEHEGKTLYVPVHESHFEVVE
jgi:hypothetical protein